jgi:XTP/dITP diphosphohydrolase
VSKLLVATTNLDKVREIRPLLAGLPIEIITLADLPPVEPPEESGATFEENARLKASYYASATGIPAVAEDSGLEIEALEGAPGVASSRFGGADTSYDTKFALIYEALRRKGRLDSAARFVCAVALADRGRIVFEGRGTVEGRIAPEPRGSGGFGYDPIFFYPPFGRTLAEAANRKSEVSHRAAAFRQLRAYLEGRQAGA